jgi:hypothetical protein
MLRSETLSETTDDVFLYKQVKQSKRISDCSDDEVKLCLKGIYFLIGLSVNQILSHTDDHKAAIISYIRENFGFRTIKEFELAFKMYIQGDFGENDKNVNFSPKFIWSVLNKYELWSQKQFEVVEQEKIQNAVKLPTPKPEGWHELYFVDELYSDYLKGEININQAWQVPSFVFDKMLDSAIVEASNEKAIHYYTKAQAHLILKYKDELKGVHYQKQLGKYKELETKIKQLQQPLEDSQELPEMQLYAKAFYVIDFFETCKQNKVEKISSLKK